MTQKQRAMIEVVIKYVSEKFPELSPSEIPSRVEAIVSGFNKLGILDFGIELSVPKIKIKEVSNDTVSENQFDI